MRRPLLALLTTALLVVLAACGDDDQATTGATTTEGPRPTVVVTTTVLGDVVADVVGDLAEVEVLLPQGADPHDWEPSARDAAALAEADLVIANGLGLEAGVAPLLDQVAADGVPVLEVAPELSPIPLGAATHAVDDGDTHAEGEGHDHGDDDHTHGTDDDGHDHADDDGHDHGEGLDPHVWMDPDRMGAAAALIATAVADATGLDAAVLAANAAAVDEQLRVADEEIQAELARIPDDRRVLVTNHDSLGYFAERYGFEVVGVVIPGGSTLAEPSAGELAELAAVVADAGVPAVFADATVDTSLAQALAAEAGGDVEVVVLYTGSLGPPGSGADTLVGMLTTNARAVADALAA